MVMIIVVGFIVILVDGTMRFAASSFWPNQSPMWQIGGIGISHLNHYISAELGYRTIADNIVILLLPTIIWIFLNKLKTRGRLTSGGLFMMIIGAITNTSQLVLWGYITDWLYLDPPRLDHFPANWNLADLMIYAGFALLIVGFFIETVKEFHSPIIRKTV